MQIRNSYARLSEFSQHQTPWGPTFTNPAAD